ncbi:MAG: hypothetical protein CMO01_27120 [Thalassobius sp.]|nr:hypothetical protein [Thalassovita sp.]
MYTIKNDVQKYLVDNCLPIAVCIDIEGVIITSSDLKEEVFFKMVKTIEDVFESPYQEMFNRVFDNCKKTKCSKSLPSYIKIISDNKRNYLVSIIPYENKEKGLNNYYIVVLQPQIMNLDFSVNIAKEEKIQEIKVKNAELEKANNKLERFVYSVTHDLRAPIASAIGLSNLILATDDLAEIHKLNMLKMKTLTNLDQFINDILDYSRNSRIELCREKIEFKQLVNVILLAYQQIILDKNIKVYLNVNESATFISDRLRITIILNNLISNAFKFLKEYGKDSQITIDIKTKLHKAEIKISDNGIGIEEGLQSKIFKMFYRATDKKPGSGIGLYILKECLDKLNGEILVESQPRKGTTFIVSLPTLDK